MLHSVSRGKIGISFTFLHRSGRKRSDMHGGDRAIKMAGTSALVRSVIFARVQVVVRVYISALSVKMFNSDELRNFSKAMYLAFYPEGGGTLKGAMCVIYKQLGHPSGGI